MQNTRFSAIPLLLVMLILLISWSPLISSLINDSVIMKNYGVISATNITARSGSPEDIQAAVDAVAAAGVGIVYVPAGYFPFDVDPNKLGPDGNPAGVIVPGGVSVIGMGRDKTILYNSREPTLSTTMFYLDGRNGIPTRISGIKFQGNVTTGEYGTCGIRITNTLDLRVDHCSFIDFSTCAIGVVPMGGSGVRGVFDHNEVDNPYKEQPGSWDWAYGIICVGRNLWQPMDYFLGKYDGLSDILYIEDNNFSRCRYAAASNTGAWYVFRHNVVYLSPNYGSFSKAGVDVHEGSPGDYPGGRGLEAYNNTFLYVGDYGQQAFKIRGGSGVIYNNIIRHLDTGVWLLYNSAATTPQNYVTNLYIWNNNMIEVTTPIQVEAFYQENVHYFLYEKPYTPYPYPHPLTL